MRTQLIKISNRVIEGGIILTVFLIPLLFFPFVSESDTFEFSKQMVLYFIGGAMLFFWVLRMIAEEKVEVRRTPIDFLIFFFLAVYVLATIFSIDRWMSVFGDHPYLHGGLVSIAVYVLFYYLVIFHVREKAQWTRVMLAMFFSAGAVSVIGMSRFLRLDLGIIDFQDPIWELLGSSEKAAMWLTMVFPMLLAFLFYAKQFSQKIFLTLLGVMLLGYLAVLNFYPSLIMVGAVGILFLVIIKVQLLRQHLVFLIPLLVVFGVIAGVNNIPALKNQFPYVRDLSVSREISLGSQASWGIVLEGFTHPKNIFLGSGSATYLYDFSSFRSVAFNATPLWGFQFSRASNEVFQLISTVGVIGLLAFFSIFILSLRRLVKEIVRKRGEETPLFLGLGAALVNFLFLSLFTTTATAASFYAWLFLALLFGGFAIWGRKGLVNTLLLSLAAFPVIDGLILKNTKKRETLPWIVFFGTVIVLAVFFFFEGKYFLGDIYYKKSLRSSTVGEAMINAGRAVSLFPQNVNYRIARARISLSSAANFAMAKEQFTKDEERDLTTLLVTARDEANAAATIAPWNPLTWETRGDVFLALAMRFNVTGAEDEALLSYMRARQFSPTVFVDPVNPRYPNLIGFIQFRFKENLDLAQQNFFLALNLKPDYAAAAYNLAQVYIKKENKSQAEELISGILVRYDALDAQQIADLGIAKEQLQKEKDALSTSL